MCREAATPGRPYCSHLSLVWRGQGRCRECCLHMGNEKGAVRKRTAIAGSMSTLPRLHWFGIMFGKNEGRKCCRAASSARGNGRGHIPLFLEVGADLSHWQTELCCWVRDLHKIMRFILTKQTAAKRRTPSFPWEMRTDPQLAARSVLCPTHSSSHPKRVSLEASRLKASSSSFFFFKRKEAATVTFFF